MFRTYLWAVMLMVTASAACHAQIISNPVVTSWPTGTGSALTTYPMPAAPVPADVCTPPVVTFCDPCAAPAAPVTSFRVPSTVPVPAPVTAYRWPVQVVARPGLITPVPVRTTRVFRPVWQPVTPGVPVVAVPAPTVTTAPMPAAPVTSYYAPSVTPAWSSVATPVAAPSPPVSAGSSGCNCQGR